MPPVRPASTTLVGPVTASSITDSGDETVLGNDTVAGNFSVGGTLGVTGPANFNKATLDSTGGSLVPNQINTNTYYWSDDFCVYSNGSYLASGNSNSASLNVLAQITTSTVGIVSAATSSVTLGGGITGGDNLALVKSSTITYRWRQLFYVSATSTATNRFTAVFGGLYGNGGMPSFGPYISYTDNVIAGKWLLGSAYNGSTFTTTNSNVLATTGWHALTITLVNGTYTYALDGATLGTVTDLNILTSFNSSGTAASTFSVGILPNTAYTTPAVVAIDRADFYVTGLAR